VPQDKFYQTLVKLKVRKASVNHPNLSKFLALNDANPDKIFFKKLVRVIEQCLKSHYLKSFGYKK